VSHEGKERQEEESSKKRSQRNPENNRLTFAGPSGRLEVARREEKIREEKETKGIVVGVQNVSKSSFRSKASV